MTDGLMKRLPQTCCVGCDCVLFTCEMLW